ncbi:MAG TPA: hypothetical protein DIV86_04310 [Alphaproteobacteria bacterium]|nr:hypothetical protein [Alphaproteobacteria bacterium]
MNKLLKSLIFKSSLIQKNIDEEYSAKHKNWIRLIRLKKLRLKIKDKIYTLAKRLSYKFPDQYKSST